MTSVSQAFFFSNSSTSMSYPRRHSSAFRVSTANLQAEQSPGHTGIPGPGSRTTGRVGGVGQSTCWGWWECSPPAAIPCRASPPLLVSAVRLRRFGRATPAGVGRNAPPPPLGKWLAGGSPAAPWLPAKKTQRWHSLLRHPCGMAPAWEAEARVQTWATGDAGRAPGLAPSQS